MTDSPCIAVCTTLYDEVCKGCGRTYIAVAQWNGMTEEQKQGIWNRIDSEATAWRYNIYKDRVKEDR
jgi:predicted Fe-S protein YdhL (DUF1289 family)